jgi:hypothetical protein
MEIVCLAPMIFFAAVVYWAICISGDVGSEE